MLRAAGLDVEVQSSKEMDRRTSLIAGAVFLCSWVDDSFNTAWAFSLTTGRGRRTATTSSSLLVPLQSSNIQPEWWNECDVNELPYDSALRALEAYHRQHGDLAIPGKFIVPRTNGTVTFSTLLLHIHISTCIQAYQ